MGLTVQSTHMINLSILIVALVVFIGVDSKTCKKINSCSCTYGSDEIIDLSPLNGNAAFRDQWFGDFLFSYNPCTPFDEKACHNVSVCFFNGTVYQGCGTQESASFHNDVDGSLYLSYSSNDTDGTIRTSQVSLICDQNGPDTFKVKGESPKQHYLYLFELSSPHCCHTTEPVTGGLSAGSVVLIIFFSITISYFLFGTVYGKLVRNANGSEALPHHTFWLALPGLVRDGTLFVLRCGKGNYNEI